MTLRWIVLGCLLPLVGCDTITEKGCPGVDLKEEGKDDGGSPDMLMPPKCAAAAGVAGTNLVCVDFNQVSGLTDSKLSGWDFTTNCGGMNWTIASGQLQIKNFSGFASSTCGFTLPALAPADYQKYGTFTLSIIHRIDISETSGQKVQVMLGADDPMSRLVTQWTGKGSRQTSIMQMVKADLPNGGTASYQPLLKLSSTTTAGGSFQGWMIESIAVNASP